jgi:hypothetical protein
MVHSVDAANAFALHGGGGHAKSTIVIVPSECQHTYQILFKQTLTLITVLLNTWAREIEKSVHR